MPSDKEHFTSLVKLVLPPEIFEYFDIIRVETIEKEVHIHLDEKAIKPEGYEIVKLISKGFHQAAIIQDFPLRDKAMYLHVRRRRWFCESTGKIVERDWDAVAKGTRLTKDFATFLKGIFGHLPNQQ
jgi:transposase